MNTSGNTVLITGGGTGIGLALAKSFSERGNKVIICGRREEKLNEAKKSLPCIITRRCDISQQAETNSLISWIISDFPETNILVNNAGIQREIDLRKGTEDILRKEDEINTNLSAQIYLAANFVTLFFPKSKNNVQSLTYLPA
jgi:uncharacterized oxidoreductase